MKFVVKSFDEYVKLLMSGVVQLKDEKVVIEEEEDEEWRHIVSTKGKSKTTKELIISVRSKLTNMANKSDVQRVETKLARIEEHLLRVAERSCRANFSVVYQEGRQRLPNGPQSPAPTVSQSLEASPTSTPICMFLACFKRSISQHDMKPHD
ncbi:hypothetical protein GOP47_0026315 [Adiantum capillus-veneris]|nr:hypothetical protein GOP47_0026315 [Adiantum capillus-veneris]